MMESQGTSRKAQRKCDPCRRAKQKCNPSERIWDENTKQKCIRCTKAGDDCGPNLTQFESDATRRGKKRKAKQSLDHGSTPSNGRSRSNFGTPSPHSSSHHDPKTIEATPGKATSFAGGDDNAEPESTPSVDLYGNPVDAHAMLETSNQLLSYYQYINHPKQTIFFLEQDALPQGPAFCQKHVATYLAMTIQDELAGVVQKVDTSHCSAEHVLLLVREAVHRFRRLAGDEEGLLKVEYEMLDKRVRVAQRNTTSKGKQRGNIPFSCKGWQFHQQTLEMERNEVKKSSRSTSPEIASTPSSNTSAGSKQIIRQASCLISSRETANLLQDSRGISHASDYISSRSFAKNRRLRGKEMMEFPAPHRAFLFGTDQEARFWARWLESNNENVELVDFFKRKVAHVAAEVGRVHLLNVVLPGHRNSLDKRDAFGLTPLMIAVHHGHLACCKLLIKAGFSRDVRDSSSRNLLSIACRRCHPHIVEYLINELSFPPNDDDSGCICSPLHDAIESGDLPICAFLLNSGANVYQQFNNKMPGELALEKGQTSIFQLIDEKMTRTSWRPVDPVSNLLGYQHGPNLQYNQADDVDRPISQQNVHDSQTHEAVPHSTNVPQYAPTTTNTQYATNAPYPPIATNTQYSPTAANAQYSPTAANAQYSSTAANAQYSPTAANTLYTDPSQLEYTWDGRPC